MRPEGKYCINEEKIKEKDGKEKIKEIYDSFLSEVEKWKKKINKNVSELYVYLLVGYDIKSDNAHYKDKRKYLIVKKGSIGLQDDTDFRSFHGLLDSCVRDLSLPNDNYFENIPFVFIVSLENKSETEKYIESIVNKKTKKTNQEEMIINYEPIMPKYNFEQIILDDITKDEIMKTVSVLKYRNKIYEDWGFKKVEPVPRAIINFYGPPGTGKTMTAHAISNHFGKKLLALNYAEIESKWVGEAPKNLIRAFETAEKENAVLFFDEADSFLGKRITSVSSSSDQAVNSLRSQMILLLDNFPGIVIFATNLLTNYDRAFESRILKHIKFNLPDKEARKKIIKVMLPNEIPFDNYFTDSDIDNLSELSEGFSGREIKNSILDALLKVAYEERNIVTFQDFNHAFLKAKEQKEKLNKEYKQTSPISGDQKKALEEKIKSGLKEQDKNKAVLQIAAHAVLAKNVIQKEELELFEKVKAMLKVDINIPENKNDLPPLDELVKKIDTVETKIQTIDFIIHFISADGNFEKDEKEFLVTLCKLMQINEENQNKLINITHLLSDAQLEWLKLKGLLGN